MYEKILEKLIEKYQAQGLSLDRILSDPTFRDLPTEQKVGMIIKYGNAIKAGQRIDSAMVKNLGQAVGYTAIAALPLVPLGVRVVLSGYNKNFEGHPNRDQYAVPTPEFAKKQTLHPTLTFIAGSALAPAVATWNAHSRQLNVRKAVKDLIKDDEPVSQENAIELLTRTM